MPTIPEEGANPPSEGQGLTYITAMYAMHAVMSKALRTEFDDVDEPIVEIPAPGDDQTFRT